MHEAKLLVVGSSDEDLADTISLERLPMRFGRARENDVALGHPLVSRVHCEVFEQHGKLYVRDLGSLNGTFVGSRRIEQCELQPGDLLTVGVVTFRAVYDGYDYEASLGEIEEALADEDNLDTQPLAGSASEKTHVHSRARITHRGRRRRGKDESASDGPACES